jgi:hypothetical protein
MAVTRCAILILLVGAACGAQLNSQAKAFMDKAKQALTARNGEYAVDRQAFEQDSYLAALEYSQNSAALQGEGGGFSGFLRSVRNAVSEFGISGTGVAAAVAVPLVALGGLALLSPLALGRKKRDVDGMEYSEDESKSPDAVDRLRSRVTTIYSDVVSSDECIERLVCELGSVAKNVYYKDSVIRVMNYFAPSSYKKYMSTLKSAAFTGDTSKCRMIKCTPIGL